MSLGKIQDKLMGKVKWDRLSKKERGFVMWCLSNIPHFLSNVFMFVVVVWIFNKAYDQIGFERIVVTQLAILIVLGRLILKRR